MREGGVASIPDTAVRGLQWKRHILNPGWEEHQMADLLSLSSKDSFFLVATYTRGGISSPKLGFCPFPILETSNTIQVPQLSKPVSGQDLDGRIPENLMASALKHSSSMFLQGRTFGMFSTQIFLWIPVYRDMPNPKTIKPKLSTQILIRKPG